MSPPGATKAPLGMTTSPPGRSTAQNSSELLDLIRQGVEGPVDQKVILLQKAEADQLHPAPAEGLDVWRRGKAETDGRSPPPWRSPG